MLSAHLEAQIAQLDGEISALKIKLAELSRRRNALLPISRLPPELVIKVLSFSVQDAVSQEWYSDVPFFRWAPAVQFYAYWRRTALGCPALWTRIWTTNLGFMRAFVDRSLDQSLDVVLCSWPIRRRIQPAEYDEIFSIILENLGRIKTLSVQIECSSIRERAHRLCTTHAPRLETLRYYNRPGMGEDAARIDPPCSNIVPNLRRIDVSYCSLDHWSTLLLAKLPTVDTVTLTGITFRAALNVIQRCPNVRHLSIDCTLDRDSRAPMLSTVMVILPNLQHLRLRGADLPALAGLTLPSITRMEIEILPADLGDPSRTFWILERLFKPFNNPSRASARLDHFCVAFDDTRYAITGKDAAGETLIALLVHGSLCYPHSLVIENLVELTHTMTIPITLIDVDKWHGRSLQDLFYLLQDCPNVQTMRIRNTNALIGFLTFPNARDPACDPDSADSNSTSSSSSSNQNQPAMDISPRWPPQSPLFAKMRRLCRCEGCHDMRVSAFPNLETLVLEEVNEEKMAQAGDAEWLELLLAWLEGRRERGLEVDMLRFAKSMVCREFLERAMGVVNGVDVDLEEVRAYRR